jgi:hypothetical protein
MKRARIVARCSSTAPGHRGCPGLAGRSCAGAERAAATKNSMAPGLVSSPWIRRYPHVVVAAGEL